MNEEKLEQYLKLLCKGKSRTKMSGIPIGSSRDGYFYAVTAGEVYGTIRKLREMAKGLESAITGLERSLDAFGREEV